jgi:hypothetical protein
MGDLGITPDSLKMPTCEDHVSRPIIVEPGSFDYYLQRVKRPMRSSSIIALYPEWPYTPYLSIEEPERKRRLKLLSLNPPESNEELAAQIMPKKSSRAFYELLADLLEEKKTVVDLHLRLPCLEMSDTEMVRSFKALLKIRRTCKFKPNMRDRSLRSALTALAAYRILRVTGRKCLNRQKLYDELPSLYADPKDWIRAIKRVERLIAKFDDSFPP